MKPANPNEALQEILEAEIRKREKNRNKITNIIINKREHQFLRP